MALPKDAAERKQHPIARGLLDYFPDACAEVAHVSFVANEQHNPGEPMHWAKEKSTDEADALVRHLLERGTLDSDGLRHSAKVAWRGLALLQRELEAEQNARAEVNFEPFATPEFHSALQEALQDAEQLDHYAPFQGEYGASIEVDEDVEGTPV